jgi:hypothetical protein
MVSIRPHARGQVLKTSLGRSSAIMLDVVEISGTVWK